MELIYIWIAEHFILRKCSLNFSSRFLIKEKFDVNKGQCILNASENSQYVNNFFPPRVTNVSAIVGANGVGKSSLLDFIIRLNHHPETIGGAYLAVFKTGNSFIIINELKGFNESNQWQIIFKPAPSISTDAVILRNTIQGLKKYRNENSLPGIASIFYNPSFDLKDYNGSLNSLEDGILDVSTNYLISKDNENNTEGVYDQVEQHRFKNTYRQFRLAQSELVKSKDLHIPENIEVRFNKNTKVDKDDLGSQAKAVYKWLEELGMDAVNNANGPIEDLQSYRTDEEYQAYQRAKLEKVKLWFLRNLVDDFFDNLSREKDLNDKVYQVRKPDIENLSFSESVKIFFTSQVFLGKANFTVNYFIEEIFSVIDNYALTNVEITDNEAFFIIPVSQALAVHNLHFQYIGLFRQRKRVPGFLDFNWRDMSNGQKAFLDLYARIYYGYRCLEPKLHETTILYLLIDEGELGFHPQWQKGYINNLLNFLVRLTDLQVQVFLTSHSPFVLSDLPKTNIVLLDKDVQGNTYAAELSVKNQTFASNIHELFMDSFFIKNGTLGDFAKNKIEEVIRTISGKNPIPESEVENVKQFISLIGEPIIRDRLKDMFIEKFGRHETLQERIDRLQKELNDAQNQMNQSRDQD